MTLKMLPILIKAINKNKLIDKFLDVYTTPRSGYEKGYTTEYPYKKNVFSGRSNWIRFPTSRLLAIEYKTSPIVYFKTPKNDYFTKIRKIRDYQRIMNYVDKMISDRVTFGSTQAMTKYDDYAQDETQTQKTVTTPISKNNKGESHSYSSLTKKEIAKEGRSINCKCPKKISEILKNLISNIKLLMPSYESTEQQQQTESAILANELEKSPCDKDDTQLPSTTQPISTFNIDQTEQPTTQKTTPSTASVTDVKVDYPEQYVPTKLNDIKRDQTLKTIVSLLQPKFMGQQTYDFKGHTKHTTTPPMYIERTEIIEEKTTLPTLKQSFNKHDPLHLMTTAPDYNFLNKINYNKRIPTDLVYNDSTEDKDIFTTDSADNYLNLDVHSLELVKRKLISSCKKTKEIVFQQPYRSSKNNALKSTHDRKWYNFQNNTSVDITKILYPIASVHYLYHSQNTTVEITTAKTITTAEATTSTTEKREALTKALPTIPSTIATTTTPTTIQSTKSTIVTKLLPIKNKLEPRSEKKVLEQKFKEENFRSEELNLDDDFEKIIIEDNYQENDYKDRHMEDLLSHKDNNMENEMSEINENKGNIVPKSVDNKDKDDFFFTSMALYNKPRSYLDIQKSNKQDDNYNLDLNNLFE